MRNGKYKTLQIILEGKIEGKRPRGRRRISWLKNMQQRAGKLACKLIHVAMDRSKYSDIEANLW